MTGVLLQSQPYQKMVEIDTTAVSLTLHGCLGYKIIGLDRFIKSLSYPSTESNTEIIDYHLTKSTKRD